MYILYTWYTYSYWENNDHHTNTRSRLLNKHSLTGAVLFLVPCDGAVPGCWGAADTDALVVHAWNPADRPTSMFHTSTYLPGQLQYALQLICLLGCLWSPERINRFLVGYLHSIDPGLMRKPLIDNQLLSNELKGHMEPTEWHWTFFKG